MKVKESSTMGGGSGWARQVSLAAEPGNRPQDFTCHQTASCKLLSSFASLPVNWEDLS